MYFIVHRTTYHKPVVVISADGVDVHIALGSVRYPVGV